MTLSFNRYININSGVGGATQVANRNLCLRGFTDNPLLPPDTFLEFTSSTPVGAYFGTNSVEFLRANFYFNWISKNITTPQLISFARWVDADVAPLIYGAVLTQNIGTYTSITNGSFEMTIGSTANTFTGLDFSAALSLADVAAVIQTAINAKTGVMWTAATVVFESIRGSFNFTGGDAVAATISVANLGTGTSIAPLIGWLTGAIFSSGALTETITEVLTDSLAASNNFGSFIFLPVLTLDQHTDASVWTDEQNVVVEYYPRFTNPADANNYFIALSQYGGVGLVYSPLSGEYPEQAPAMILAATNYTAINSVQNYMFQQFNLTPSVTDNTTADTFDSRNINYYGVTQESGQQIAFFQRGKLFGTATDPTDMNTFSNEVWLKDAAGVALMNLFLAMPKISANNQGRTQIVAILQSIINQALGNGTISVGKTLSTIQKLYITEITGDPNAWQQVQNTGYWLNCEMVPFVDTNSNTEYKAVYTLVYSKDDVIRMVDGTHVLI